MTLARWLRGARRKKTGIARPGGGRLAEMRLVVLDIDVTGIDVGTDKVTGVAWLPVEESEFALGMLRCTPLGDADQGRSDAWAAMLADIGDSPIVTYNAGFIRRMLERVAADRGWEMPRADWLDIASALYGIVGEAASESESMVIWQTRMNIDNVRRHAAVADVFAIAQTLQTLLAYCDDLGIATLDDLRRAQDARIWMRG